MNETSPAIRNVTNPDYAELAPQIARRMSRARERDTVVIMRMPHCEPLFANKPFGPRGEEMRVARTIAEVQALLTRADEDHTVCFCREMSTMLAFRPEDCAHESDFEDFCADPLQGTLSGFEFYLDGQIDKTRTYRVARVHSRLHRLRKGIGTMAKGLIEVRVVESESLRMIVTTSRADTLKVTVKADGVTLIDEMTCTIDRERLPAYSIMEKALEAVIQTPGDAERILDEALRAVETIDPSRRMYPTCNDVRNDVAAEPSSAQGVLNILFDGPVAGTYARRELRNLLNIGSPLSLPTSPRAVAADLARIRLRSDTLEATDPIVAVAD